MSQDDHADHRDLANATNGIATTADGREKSWKLRPDMGKSPRLKVRRIEPALLEATLCTLGARFENLRGGHVFDLGPALFLGLRLLRAARVLAQLRKRYRPRQAYQHFGQRQGGQVMEHGPFVFRDGDHHPAM